MFGIVYAVAVGFLIVLVPLTRSYTQVWKDSKTLWSYTYDLDPRCEHAAMNLANLSHDDPDLAIKLYRRTIETNPNMIEGYINLGNFLTSLDRTREARGYYEQALRLDVQDGRVWASLGDYHVKLRQFDQAIACYSKSIKLRTPLSALTFHNLGIAWQARGDLDKALEAFQSALKVQPQLPETQFNIAVILHRQGELDLAADAYQKTITLNLHDAEAHNNLGNIYYNQNRIREAERLIRRALELNPELASAHHNLSLLWASKGEFQLALEHAERSKQLGEQLPPELLHMLREKAASNGG